MNLRIFGALLYASHLAPAADTTATAPQSHISLKDASWTGSRQYPPELLKVYRYKALIGGQRPGVIPQEDILMGVLELAPGATYPAHKHPAPELYYVIGGKVRWTVGDETFEAGPGEAIYHAPNTLHRMVNIGAETLRMVYLWWAPGGDRSVLRASSQLLEPVPPQPPSAVFPER